MLRCAVSSVTYCANFQFYHNTPYLQYVWPLLQLYELATTMRANIAKFIAILCGALSGRNPPILPPPATLIRWLKHGEYTKILGIPFWSTGGNDVFWHELHTKIKKRVATTPISPSTAGSTLPTL
jgi:hypothetical protein